MLGVAALYSRVSVLEVLLKYGAEINKKDLVSSINLTVKAVMLKNFYSTYNGPVVCKQKNVYEKISECDVTAVCSGCFPKCIRLNWNRVTS